jgi:hypothetical protein
MDALVLSREEGGQIALNHASAMKLRAIAKFFALAAIPTVILATVAFPVDAPYDALLGSLPSVGVAYLGFVALFTVFACISRFYSKQPSESVHKRDVGSAGGSGGWAFARVFGVFYLMGVIISGGAALNADNVAVFATGYVLTLAFYAIALSLSDRR